MMRIKYFFAKLKCKNDFKRAVNNIIKIREKRIESILYYKLATCSIKESTQVIQFSMSGSEGCLMFYRR